MTAVLRPHQIGLIGEIDKAIAEGCRRIVAQAPTGFGKTIVGAHLIKHARAKGHRVIFTVPRLSLIDQTIEKLWAEDVRDIGVMQAGHPDTNPTRPVQVASIQTLIRRQIPPADLVIIDEVHIKFDFFTEWLKDPRWAEVPFIGLTATPWTRGLGKLFDKLIIGSTTQELIDAKYLSGFRVFAPSSPDLTGIQRVAGDYHEGELSELMSEKKLVADVVDTWLVKAKSLPTLCFCVDLAHARHIEAKFLEHGVATAYIDHKTTADERKVIAKKFASSEADVVVSVGCLTTGIDWDVHCISLARPTRSEILFVQMVGRGLRTADDKTDCLILDHSDNHLRLGFVTDIHHQELDSGEPRAKSERSNGSAAPLPQKCPSCGFLMAREVTCPNCGFAPQRRNQIRHQDGELVEMTARNAAKAVSNSEKLRFYLELKGYADEHGYQSGWCYHKFIEKFGHKPEFAWKPLAPLIPSQITRSWIRSRNIAWAKSRPARPDRFAGLSESLAQWDRAVGKSKGSAA